MKRVVITGAAGVSPIGLDWEQMREALQNHRSGIVRMADWAEYDGLNTQLGGPVPGFEVPAHFNRKVTRTMGRVSKMAVTVTEQALAQAGLLDDPTIQDGRMGVAYGSSTGSTDAVMEFGGMLLNKSLDGLNATSYIRMMAHTAAVNIGVHFGLKGRVHTTSSACTSGSQGIGYAFEAIRAGKQQLMVAGGAEELCPSEAAVFDTLYATSTKNDTPTQTPSPFDVGRDGLVIGEGACTLILEELTHAQARGATILAEIIGFATNADGSHVTRPSSETMEVVMRLGLEDASIAASEVGYVCAHGTATEQGDIAESQASFRVFGGNTPVSSLKGHTGHTLGACGALESWAAIQMMNEGWCAPTLNLAQPDERCGALDYVIGSTRPLDTEIVVNNNFAFGGINTSLVFRRWP